MTADNIPLGQRSTEWLLCDYVNAVETKTVADGDAICQTLYNRGYSMESYVSMLYDIVKDEDNHFKLEIIGLFSVNYMAVARQRNGYL